MFSAILILLIIPFTDLSRSRGIQFKPLSKVAFFLFVANFLILMELGAKHVESPFIEFGQISTVVYFAYFLIMVPLISLVENTLIELYLESDESLESDDRRQLWYGLNMVQSSPIPLTNLRDGIPANEMPKLGEYKLPKNTTLSKDGTTIICPSQKGKVAGLYSGNPVNAEGDIPPKLSQHLVKVQHRNGDCEMIDPDTGWYITVTRFINKKGGGQFNPEYKHSMDGIIAANKGSHITSGRGNLGDGTDLSNERIVHDGFSYIKAAASAFPVRSDTPRPWGIYFQDSASPQMEALVELHNNILFYLVIILFGVGWLLIIIVRKYTTTESPISYKYSSHGTLIELIWTITPALILILIAFPSFKLLYLMDEVIDPAMAILAEGHQWYWSYQYPDFLNSDDEFIEFDSYLIPESDLEDGTLRMLEVDNRLILPEHTHVRIIVTGADVIHSLACPALGLKCDAYPGRLNQTSVIISREGTFYGQCSEICGILHSSMPIVIESVSIEKFVSWLREQ